MSNSLSLLFCCNVFRCYRSDTLPLKSYSRYFFNICFVLFYFIVSCFRCLLCGNVHCTTFHRYPIFSTRYSVMCKVYTGYCGTSEIEHGLCACTVDNPLAKARGLSLRTGAQTMLYLPHVIQRLPTLVSFFLF